MCRWENIRLVDELLEERGRLSKRKRRRRISTAISESALTVMEISTKVLKKIYQKRALT